MKRVLSIPLAGIAAACLLLAAPPNARAALEAYYTFDGNANDSSGNAYNGTVNGTASYVSGVIGNAFDFTGSSYVSTGATASALNISGASAKTVEGWVYTRSYNGSGMFDIGNYDTVQNFSLRTLSSSESSTNNWRVQFWGSDYDFNYNATDKWVHFALTYDGTTATAYMGGNSVATFTPSTLATTATSTMNIGRWNTTNFDGKIDDVKVYSGALSGAAITSHANALFADNRTATAVSGLGNVTTSGVKVRIVNNGDTAISTIDAGETVLANGSMTGDAYGVASTINYGTGSHHTGGSWPTNTAIDRFALQATGFLVITTAGDYTFGVNSDDGFRLRIGKDMKTVTEYTGPRGPADTMGTVTFAEAGVYAYQLTYFENDGGDNVQLYAKQGTSTTWDGTEKLVGDTANGGLQSIASGAFHVRSVVAASGNTINSVAAAEALLNGSTAASSTTNGDYSVINFNDGSTANHYGSTSSSFPSGQNLENYAVLATAKVWITEAGTYTFGANTDDGCKLVINGTTLFTVGDRGAADSLATYTFGSAGFYDLSFLMYEDGGGSNMELFAAKGTYTTFDSSAFRLIGDVANGGLAVLVPEPGSLVLLTAGLLGLLAYAWRKRK